MEKKRSKLYKYIKTDSRHRITIPKKYRKYWFIKEITEFKVKFEKGKMILEPVDNQYTYWYNRFKKHHQKHFGFTFVEKIENE
tara:strand:- start:8368 stop:8616 length:249 start_codon:yes stop_codon:yes gene_type:complete